ncbi:MAG: hypothetical protein ACXVYS_12015 [Oryzihumus sp.]
MPSAEEMDALSAEFRAAIHEIQELTDSLRDGSAGLLEEVRAERDSLRQAREREADELAAAAREGEHGPARQELQRRLDRAQTTWRAVMSGQDEHWSAVEVRAEVVGDARQAIDDLEKADPGFADTYREIAPLRADKEPGEW